MGKSLTGPTLAVSRRSSATSCGPLAPSLTLCCVKISWKWPKRPFFCFPHFITRPPGGQIKKRRSTFVRLGPKIIPAKFRPNLSTFRATFYRKTYERRTTPCKIRVASRPSMGGLRPPWGVASQPPSSVRTALKKGTTSLRSVVNYIFLNPRPFICLLDKISMHRGRCFLGVIFI